MKNSKTTIQTQPLVSVIMTAYNAGAYIGRSLESIINQTYTNMEIIVVDDRSTDNTVEVIKKYAKKDNRIKLFVLPENSGPSTGSNFAFTKTNGKYIARLDADDIAYPDRIAKQVAFLQTNSDVVVVGGQCEIIDEQDNVIGYKNFPVTHTEIYKSLFMINPVQHPAWMYRKDVFTKHNITYLKRYFICHDLKILFELLDYGKFANLPYIVLQYRYRPTSITHKNPKRTFQETLEIRNWAWMRGGYKPTPLGIVTHIAQTALVYILPNKLINELFQIWRVKKIQNMKKLLQSSFQTTYQVALQLALILLIRYTKINNG